MKYANKSIPFLLVLPFALYKGCSHSSRSWYPQARRNRPGGTRGWRKHHLGPSRSSLESILAGGSPECSGSIPAEEPPSRPVSTARCGRWPAMPRGSPPPGHGPPGCIAHRPGLPKSWWKRCLAMEEERQLHWVMQRACCRIRVSDYSASLWTYHFSSYAV